MPLPWPIANILQRWFALPQYSVRVLIIDLKSTGVHFIHLRPESEGGNVEYNLEDRALNPSPNDLPRKYPLRDGAHIIFPFNRYESADSDESCDGPPCFDSNGNEYSEESSKGPLSLDSNGHAIVE